MALRISRTVMLRRWRLTPGAGASPDRIDPGGGAGRSGGRVLAGAVFLKIFTQFGHAAVNGPDEILRENRTVHVEARDAQIEQVAGALPIHVDDSRVAGQLEGIPGILLAQAPENLPNGLVAEAQIREEDGPGIRAADGFEADQNPIRGLSPENAQGLRHVRAAQAVLFDKNVQNGFAPILSEQAAAREAEPAGKCRQPPSWLHRRQPHAVRFSHEGLL